MTIRLDPADLSIETNDKGFIIGQSLIGDTVTDEANAWREVKTEFSHLSLTRAVALEKGVLFRPEAAELSLRTPTTKYMSGVFGRQIRVKWKGTLLFVGEVKNSQLSSVAGADEDETYMTLRAIGTVQRTNTFVLYEYSAPVATTGDRVMHAVAGTSIPVQVINCTRAMPAKPQTNVKLIEVLQDSADVQMARFYAATDNTLVLDGNPAPAPVIAFSDEPEDVNRVRYKSVDMAENLDNVITGAIVTAKQFETRYGRALHPSAVVRREETYEVDLPDSQSDVDAWTTSFPLLGFTRLEPSNVDTYWQDSLIDLELTEAVNVKWQGQTYLCGIKGIRYDISPDPERGLRWDVSVELMPGHLVQRVNYAAPSPPVNVTATDVQQTSITVSWTRPVMPGSLSGYTVRYQEGYVPPADTDSGILVGSYPAGTLSATATGLDSYTNYSFSVFATTNNAEVTSQPGTLTVRTLEIVPSAATNFSVAKNHTVRLVSTFGTVWDMNHNVVFDPPVSGDVGNYFVAWTVDGSQPSLTNYKNSLTLGKSWADGSGFNRHIGFASNGERNKNIRYALWAKSPSGVYSPPVYDIEDTTEVAPIATSVTIQRIDSSRFRVHWTKEPQSNTYKDFWKYRMEYRKTGTGTILTPGTGEFVSEWTAATADSQGYFWDIIVVEDGVWLDVSVFTYTYGELWARGSAALVT